MKVMLACGGTGGHIFPAFSVAEELKSRDPQTQIVYVCGRTDIESEIFKIIGREHVFFVESSGFRGASSLLNPLFLLKSMKGFLRSLGLLLEERPDIVVGFGGHNSFPVVMAAGFRGIPTLIHEQNVMPGTANKLLARFVRGLALSFEETKGFIRTRAQVCVTGNPIRASIERGSREEALRFFGFSSDKKTLLVLGGSQGAQSINAVFAEVVKHWPSELKDRVQLLHLCGKMPVDLAAAIYKEAGITARVYSFFDRMDLVYAVTNVALGRAGATFLAEIRAKNIPAVLVPYPFAGGHQMMNAQAFAREGMAEIIPQSKLTREALSACLQKLLSGPPEPRATGVACHARGLLADFIQEFV